MNVTGPSFSSETIMYSRKRPVWTGIPVTPIANVCREQSVSVPDCDRKNVLTAVGHDRVSSAVTADPPLPKLG